MTYPQQPEQPDQPAWQQPAPQYQPPQAPKRRRRWLWISLGAVILIVVIGVATNSGGSAGTGSSPATTVNAATDCGNADATMVNGLCTEPSNEVTQTGVAPVANCPAGMTDANGVCVSVPTTTTETNPAVPPQEQEAIAAAQQYLSFSAFSRQGLIDQLSSAAGDGYPVDVATAAVDSLTVDWNAQAVKSAQQYLNYTHFSCSGLISQLDSSAGERFTKAQATYGAHQTSACG